MMHTLHLIWIIPACCFAGYICAVLAFACKHNGGGD